MATATGDATALEGWSWQGLTAHELRVIQFRFCAPINRVLLLTEGLKQPAARAGLMLGKIRQHIKNTNVGPHDVPSPRALGRILEEKGLGVNRAYFTRLFQGIKENKKPDQDVWDRFKYIFRAHLLGVDSALKADYRKEQRQLIPLFRSSEPESPDDRDRIYARLEDYFFRCDETGMGRYFTQQSLESGTPQHPDESIYQLHWIAYECMYNGADAAMHFVSGGPPFPFVNDAGEMGMLGIAAITAAVAGAKLRFAYPDVSVVGPTEASASAEGFIARVRDALLDEAKVPRTLESLWGLELPDLPTSRRTMLDNIERAAVDPTERVAEVPFLAGQLLNPVIRFTFINYNSNSGQSRDSVLLVRSEVEKPYAYEVEKSRIPVAQLWRRAFLKPARFVRADLDRERPPNVDKPSGLSRGDKRAPRTNSRVSKPMK